MAVNLMTRPDAGHTTTVPADAPKPNLDPDRDGVVGLYALRILDRGVDPRTLVAEHRSTRFGVNDRSHLYANPSVDESLISPVGRAARRTATRPAAASPARVAEPVTQPRPARVRRLGLPSVPALANLVFGSPAPGRAPRRLVTAGFAAAAMLGIGIMGAFAQEQPAQQLYVVQEGDSLESVANGFGVDPEAIAAASGLQNPSYLTPYEIVVIPGPGQTPEEAAIMAAELAGNSPFVSAAYTVSEGDTLGDIASWFQIDATELASFNGLASIDDLNVGQRLLIPGTAPGATTATTDSTAVESSDVALAPDATNAEPATFVDADGLSVVEAAQPADLAPAQAEVPTETTVLGIEPYHQAYNLSPAYAAGYIATSAFGAGVPESVFIEQVPLSPNPHWGYRGNLNGDWGNTTDYGVYAEPLIPVLNANGFNAEAFYGGGDPTQLQAYLDAGVPVIAWLGFYGDTAFSVDDHGSYQLAAGMHTVVVYGYDAQGVHVADPASGTLTYFTWDEFVSMWSILDGMALAVSPW